ncbi:MAG: RusA family crossover junction endodeoxyribonuclease [Victivallaceae bacterium]|nr:RusA family crossover junction endodeoxyribonuclease [Victivallaceae bacterium]
MEFEPPYPPSVNHYYRHVGPRVLISRAGRKYREVVVSFFRSCGIKPLNGRIELFLEAYPPDRRRRDLDNLLKCVLDAMEHAGAYHDDSQIVKITAEKHKPMPPDGMLYIRIKELCNADAEK